MRELLSMSLVLTITSLVLLTLAACSGDGSTRPADSGQPASPGPAWSGVLRGGIMHIGGEGTGWVLEVDYGELAGSRLDTDVSRVVTQAKAFEGRRVRIHGRLIEKKYVERGPIKLLAATSINLFE